MTRPPETRSSLLLRLRDHGDALAWQQFVEIYTPLIHAYARHRGLQDADAADVAQDVMRAVARNVDHFEYDPRRGTFRGWLLTVTRNQICDFVARSKAQARGAGDTQMNRILSAVPDTRDDEGIWNREHQWRLLHWAAEQVRGEFRERTWEAFAQTTLHQRDAAEVASELNLSVGAVYIAKSRVLSRIKKHLEAVEA